MKKLCFALIIALLFQASPPACAENGKLDNVMSGAAMGCGIALLGPAIFAMVTTRGRRIFATAGIRACVVGAMVGGGFGSLKPSEEEYSEDDLNDFLHPADDLAATGLDPDLAP